MYKSLRHQTPLQAIRTLKTGPPSFFADLNSPPSQYEQAGSSELHSMSHSAPAPLKPQFNQQSNPDPRTNTESPPKRAPGELAALIAMFSLAYLAVDNYSSRVKLEKLNQESTALHIKTLQLQQQNYARAKKQQDLRMIKERIETSKRCFKMSMHIAMLRKQLIDHGIAPKDINDVVEEFEQNAKISNSINNLTGHAIWLNDTSEYSGHLPNYRDYDGK